MKAWIAANYLWVIGGVVGVVIGTMIYSLLAMAGGGANEN